jgi:hypothetical protein
MRAAFLVLFVAGCNLVVGDYTATLTSADAGITPAETDAAAGPTCGASLDRAKLEPAIRACTLFLGCSPYAKSFTLSECITDDLVETMEYYYAASRAKSCADISQSYGWGDARPGECPAGSREKKCVGTRAVSCDPLWRKGGVFSDCAIQGGTCATSGPDGGAPTTVGCLVQPTCTGAPKDYQCNASNALYNCIDGKGFGSNCSTASATCENRSGKVDCFLNGPSCTGSGVTCSGGVKERCSSGTRYRYNCAAVGLDCKSEGEDTGCLSQGCTFQQAKECVESCDKDGRVANVCVGGAPVKIDCTSYGFGKCVRFNPNKDITTQFVSCAP